ncbi:calcium-binding protein [bacterium]|nr:calcium-binding protein [bacterium]
MAFTSGRNQKRRPGAWALLALLLLPACAGGDEDARLKSTASAAPSAAVSGLQEDWEGFSLGNWVEPSEHGAWRLAYTGYGRVGIAERGGKVLEQAPMASTRPDETHASLVTTRERFGDFRARVKLRTVQQLRTGSAPNPWEVPWLIWHHTDENHFYYALLKPNGWELGKVVPGANGPEQRFLATGETPFSLEAWHTLEVEQRGGVISLKGDGVALGTPYTDPTPYASGVIGLYNEDAHVAFDDVQIDRLD